ncbi:four helix bundle protein, partial [Candidatus Falkowbacteria bacterium]|nr:four helix bundle protein [Candidatus Falkowbacteria bacterium]
TSIGANIEEAIGGSSKKDFLNKLIISYKEARETIYWIKLLKETNYLEERFADSLFKDCDEICAIIGKTRKTILKDK